MADLKWEILEVGKKIIRRDILAFIIPADSGWFVLQQLSYIVCCETCSYSKKVFSVFDVPVTLEKALPLDGRTSVWQVACHRCLVVHSRIWEEMQRKKGMVKKDTPWGQNETTWIFFTLVSVSLPRRECEREVKRYIEIAHKQASRVFSLRLCHVIGNRENKLQPWKTQLQCWSFCCCFS